MNIELDVTIEEYELIQQALESFSVDKELEDSFVIADLQLKLEEQL